MSSVVTELVAGGVAGAAGIVSTQPLDTVRIRMQTLPNQGSGSPLLGCLRSTFRGEGLRGFYKGVASPTFTVGLMNSVLFLSYEKASAALRERNNSASLSLPDVALAGAASGAASAFITGPTELVKCIAQVDTRSKGAIREEWAIFRNMIARHGFTGAHGPCRGLLLTLIRDTPAFSAYFGVYEGLSRHAAPALAPALGPLSDSMVTFWAGGFAGVAAWTVTYPVDCIKTRWQTAAPGTYAGLGHCVRSNLQAEGASFMFRGFSATMLRAWPQNAVIFFVYEHIRALPALNFQWQQPQLAPQ